MGIEETHNGLEEALNSEIKRQCVPNVWKLKDKDGNVREIQINEPDYTSHLITFCKKALPAFREAVFQYNEHEFVEKVVRVAKEFVVVEDEKNDSEYLKDRLNGNILRFLNEVLLEPSTHKTIEEQETEPAKYGYRVVINRKTGIKEERLVRVEKEQRGYVAINSQKFTGTYRHEAKEIHVDALALIHYLLANYQKTLLTYKDKDEKEQLITFKSSTDPHPTNGIMYAAKFSSSFWRNLYHDVKTCKFNGGDEFIAAMLDCADEHVHHLLLMPEAKREGRKEKKSSLLPAEIVAILIDTVDTETGKEYLVVEGVFGTPWTKRDYKERFCVQTTDGKTTSLKKLEEELKEKPEELEKELKEGTIEEKLNEEELKLRGFYYGYVFDCIMEMAFKTNRGVFINYCFSGHAEPPQGSIDFVNYVEQKNKRNPYYELEGRVKDKVKKIRFVQVKEEYKQDDFSMRLRKKESSEVDKLFTPYRRFNTWYEWHKRQDELAKHQDRR